MLDVVEFIPDIEFIPEEFPDIGSIGEFAGAGLEFAFIYTYI
jgi:hypothetical protein